MSAKQSDSGSYARGVMPESYADLDLRDEFAMAALTGLCSQWTNVSREDIAASIARTAYFVADAMMKARGK